MGTTSEELKKLYKKLGGKDPKVAGFSAPGEILNAINEIPLPTEYELPTVTTEDAGDVLVVNEEGKWDKGEAGGGLPEVTTDDNGDILQVIEGIWAKAAMSKDVVVYEAEYVTVASTAYFARLINAVHKDIIDSIISGKTVLIKYYSTKSVNTRQTIYYYLHTYIEKNKQAYFVGDCFSPDLKSYKQYCYIQFDYTDSSDISLIMAKKQVPGAASIYNGKMLQVVDGEYTFVDLPSPTHAYSTTEQVVGTWIDGKPVYEKTIDCGAISANTWNQTATGVDNIDNVISIGGFVKSDTAVIPFTTNMTSSDATIHYVREQNKFQYWAIGSNATGVIIFRYTKTTD